MSAVTAEPASPPARPRVSGRTGEWLFGAAFVVAAAVTGLGVFLAVVSPERPAEGLPVNLLWLLGANLLLILPLGAAVVWRALRVKVQGQAGARLHFRMVGLFALAALIPAVIVAVFFGLLVNQGVDRWFGRQVRSAVENAATISITYLNSQARALSGEVAPIERDFAPLGAAWVTSPEAFDALMRREVDQHLLDALYVVDASGRVLARYELPNPPRWVPPPTRDAVPDEVLVRSDEAANVLRALMPIRGQNTFIYAVRKVEGLNELIGASEAVTAYRESERNRQGIQAVFALSFVETALLVIIAAMWMGTAAARSLSEPIGRVVQAAERVSSGDLSARVPIGRDPEALVVLARTFNRMTGDLNAQQEALRRAGDEAEARSRFIEAVLTDVSAGVFGLDQNDCVTAVNRQALMLLNLPEALHKNLSDVAPELEAVVRQARANPDEAEAEAEMEIVRPGGARRIRARASVREDGGAVLTFDDVTRLIAAQRNEAWRDVARRIAHEIRNPLTPIQLSAERLRRKYRAQISGDVETFDRCTDTIIRQVGDIGRMVDEFSSFARMPAPKFEEADAAEMLRQAVFSQRVAVADVPVELTAPDGPLRITCDERMIGQALINVLKNAGEAVQARRARDGDTDGGIRARLRVGEAYVVFEVEDDGVGLPAAERHRLTEPYVTTREKGTGLGLAIVKRILEDHGGDLSLGDAVEGRGARALLRIPRRAVQRTPQIETGV